MRKLAIAFLFDDTLDSDAGVAQYVKTLGAWLSEQGHSVDYLVGETKIEHWSGGTVYCLSKNFPVAFNGNRLSIPLPASSKKIDRLLRQNTYDVMHVQLPNSPFMSGRVIKRAASTTAVDGTFHILPSGRLAKLGSRLLNLIYFGSQRQLDQVLSVSAPAADFAKEYYGLNSQILPNVIDLKNFSHPSMRPQKNTIVFLGRLVERKGCQQLLEAFIHVNKWLPSARLIIAGDGPQKDQLEKFVRKHGLTEVVEFKGYIAEKEKPQLLASAQIACFPALYGESFGIVLLEAMSAGSGVVLGGNNPGYSSVLGDQKELLVDPQDTVAFARKLELLLNDTTLRQRLHKWQTLHVARYDVSEVGPKIVAAYRQAITKTSK